MTGSAKDERPVRERGRSADAQKPGGNPDKAPSANAGNVGLGAVDEDKGAAQVGSAR